MTTDELLAKALEIAKNAHEGQASKDGRPYILHPLRLADRAATDDERMVALLHDTVEDSDMTLETLRDEGFPDHIVTAIDHITKRDGEAYEDFIGRVLQDALASRVKLLDLDDNMNLKRIPHPTQIDLDRIAKYEVARARLVDALVAQVGTR